MSPEQTLGGYLLELRKAQRMTLRDVENATNGFVSNAYLSQLEKGKRLEPGPRYLAALARVYGVPVQILFEKAGYADEPTPSEIDIAFDQVLADKEFQFGTRLSGDLNESSKRAIIELYERATKKRLLGTTQADDGQDSSEQSGQ